MHWQLVVEPQLSLDSVLKFELDGNIWNEQNVQVKEEHSRKVIKHLGDDGDPAATS